jgi:hypothetical protein
VHRFAASSESPPTTRAHHVVTANSCTSFYASRPTSAYSHIVLDSPHDTLSTTSRYPPSFTMAFLSTILNTCGVLFLTHAYVPPPIFPFYTRTSNLLLTPHRSVYSAHEHTTAFTSTPLPTDITLELLLSIFALSTGIVLSAQPLRPIEAAKWAGQIAREGQRPEGQYTREGEAILSEGDPYAFLGLDGGFGEGKGVKGEGRRGFWDAKGKRREYEEWVRSGSKQ